MRNTRLKVVEGRLQLPFTGEDPGIAMDRRGRELPQGPYCLTFRLLGGMKGGGEVFSTTDPTTTPAKGERLEFKILADGTWQPITLDLPTDSRSYQLRLDVSPGAGKATIADLKLGDRHGKTLINWPAAGPAQQRQLKDQR
jgi:arylsulfatase